MTRTRSLTAALALLCPILAIGCATAPPPPTQLTSPFIGWSSTVEPTGATINVCSLAGGPVSVTIQDRDDVPGSYLSVAASINLGGQPFDGSPRLTAVGDSWVSLPLPANSCFVVGVDNFVAGAQAPAARFRFRIDW